LRRNLEDNNFSIPAFNDWGKAYLRDEEPDEARCIGDLRYGWPPEIMVDEVQSRCREEVEEVVNRES